LASINPIPSYPGRTVVLVHGRHFKPAANVLQDLWLEALRAGLRRDQPDRAAALEAATISLAYYGDATAKVLAAAGQRYDEVLDVADRRNALAQLTAFDKKRFKRSSYESLPGKTPLKEFLADVGAPLAAALHLTDWIAGRVIPELAEYWRGDTEFRAAMDRCVIEAMAQAMARGDEIIVVSHGIGSIAAYNAFWLLSRGGFDGGRYEHGKVGTWITLGSPLGDDTVRRRLLGVDAPKALRYPDCILNWFNFAAEDDYTCHDETMANDFKPMLDQHAISRIVDQRIYNLAVRYGRSNPHSAVGYLLHPRVIKVLADALAGDHVVASPPPA